MKHSTFITASAALLTAACASPRSSGAGDAQAGSRTKTLAMMSPRAACRSTSAVLRKDGTGVEWTFVAPDADLFDAHGMPIGHHGAGPYWQAADGSRVVGTVKARADAPNPGANPGAIPWLLLTTKSTTAEGAFSAITSIQRVNTVGGIAPATAARRDSAGTSARVPYTADYLFFTAR